MTPIGSIPNGTARRGALVSVLATAALIAAASLASSSAARAAGHLAAPKKEPTKKPSPAPHQPSGAAAGGKSAAATSAAKDKTENTKKAAPGKIPDEAQPAQPAATITDEAQPDTTGLNLAAENFLKSAEERTYRFSIVEGTYADLIKAFSRMSGLGIVGQPPKGTVTFSSNEEMDFKSALNRVCLLLFKHPQNFWLRYRENMLEVVRMTELKRLVDPEDIYPSVSDFLAANRDDNDLAMVLYSPDTGEVADLKTLRDFMPDYVRIAPFNDTNMMMIFALAKDIRKYLDLIRIFQGAQTDPREIRRLPVTYVSPATALAALTKLMGGIGEAAVQRQAARKARDGGMGIQPQPTVIFADDEQSALVVRAMGDKIAEIENLLRFIDIAPVSEFEPVVVALQHQQAEEVIRQITPLVDGAAGASPRARRPSRAKGSAAPTLQSAELTLAAESRSNSIVIIGREGDIARVRTLIRLFDVPADEEEPRIIRIKHVDAPALAAQITQITQGSQQPSASIRKLTAVADPAGAYIVLAGTAEDMDRAERIIQQLDTPGDDEPAIHRIKLENARPTTIASIMTNLALSKRAAKKGPARAAPVAKFQGDDRSMTLFVSCTETQWAEEYWPLIQQIDADASEDTDVTVIELEHLDPQQAVNLLNTVVVQQQAKGGVVAIRVGAAPNGVVVSGAGEVELRQIRELIAQIDIDPRLRDQREQRTFTLEHADPAALTEVLRAMVAGSAPRGAKGPAAAGVTGVQISHLGTTLVVSAPGEVMTEVADLIATLDRPDDESLEIRSYAFPTGVDVRQIASTLQSLYGSGGAAAVARKGRPPAAGHVGATRFVAQPSTRTVLVSAPLHAFDDIEKTIEMLKGGIKPDVATEYAFIDVEHGSATAIVTVVQPLLTAVVTDMRARGELPGAESAAKPAGTGLTITADPKDDRIAIAAPGVVIAEARAIIAMLDRPDDRGEQVMRTVELGRADPTEMANTIRAMLAGVAPTPTKQRPRKRLSKPDGTPAVVEIGAPREVSVYPAPNGNAVVLVGVAEEVNEVERWIKELDAQAAASRTIKIYRVPNSDTEMVADSIMTLADSTGVARETPSKQGEEEDIWDVPKGGPRRGKDIYLVTDYWNKTIVVSASPAKLREVDEIVGLYERPEGEEAPIGGSEPMAPYMMYELQHKDAYDAVFTLESVIDVLFPATDKPDVDYIPFTNILVIKGDPESFDKVVELIQTYVDQESAKVAIATDWVPARNVPASQMALLLKTRFSSGEIDIENVAVEDVDVVEVVNPCVLPQSVMRHHHALSALAVGQVEDAGDGDSKDKKSDDLAREGALLGEVFKAARQAGGTDADAPQKLRVRVDDQKGVIYMEGPPELVSEARKLLKDINDELEELPERPDIRVFRLKHVDVTVAAAILESMFGEGRQAGTSATQQRRQQQQQQALEQMRRRLEAAQRTAGGPAAREPQAEEQKTQPQQKAAGGSGLRVFPDKRTRTIIVRAKTEDFPVIVRLLGTIDKKTPKPSQYKIFQLTKLRASEVEATLRTMMGLEQSPSRRAPAPRIVRGGRGGSLEQAAMAMQQQLLQLSLGAGGESVTAEQVVIASNPSTNTVMVMAPEEIQELVGKMIAELESQTTPTYETRTYVLANADVADVVTQLKQLFPEMRGRSRMAATGSAGYDPGDVNAPIFSGDARTNTLTVRALDLDFPKIEPLIQELDRPAGTAGFAERIPVTSGSATAIAAALQSTYAPGGKRAASGMAVRLTADADSNSILVVAPQQLREEIANMIAEMDAQAGVRFAPRAIPIQRGTPTQIADKLRETFSGTTKSGGTTGNVRITGDDASRQLLVVAPDEVFTQIKSLAARLDTPPLAADVKVYRLQHARAEIVLEQMNKMASQVMKQLGAAKRGQLDLYSAAADQVSNALVVMGGPTTFAWVDVILAQLDVPPPAPTELITRSYVLTRAQAVDAAKIINGLYGKKKIEGVDPPHAEADQMTNTLVVRGTAARLDELEAQMLDGLGSGGPSAPEVFVIPLQYTDAGETLDILQNFLRKPGGAGRGRENDLVGDIRLSAAIDTNSIVVSGESAEIERVARVIATLDTEVEGPGTAPRIIRLGYARASEIEPVLNKMFVEVSQSKRGGAGRDSALTPVIVANEATNALIVRAGAVDFGLIEGLVASLDSEDVDLSAGVRTFQIPAGINVEEIAAIVEETVNEGAKHEASLRPGAKPALVTIRAHKPTNTILVAGAPSQFALVENTVNRIARLGPAGGQSIRFLRLKHRSAEEMKQVLQQVVEEQTGGGKTSRPRRRRR